MVRHAFLRGTLQQVEVVDFIDAANCDIFPGRHFITHEVLKDDSNFPMKIFQIVLAEVDPIQQDLALGRIIESGDQFYDGRFALSVLADQCEPLVRVQLKINLVQDPAGISRITERDVSEFDAPYDRPGRRQGILLRLDRRLHIEKCQQIGDKECLVSNPRQRRENLLDVAAGLLNGSRQKG